MKKLCLTLLVAAFSLPVFAQISTARDSVVTHYVFSDFLDGIVKKRSGELVELPLNYNTITEEMIFIRDTQRLAIAFPEEVDTIFVGGKVFVPFKNVYYEKATNTTVPLFVENKVVLLRGGKEIGYGNKIQTGSINSITAIASPTQLYKLQLPQDYSLADHTSYWIFENGKFEQLTSAKKLQGLFPAKADAIKRFVSDNNIDFNRRDDLVKLIEFCNQG